MSRLHTSYTSVSPLTTFPSTLLTCQAPYVFPILGGRKVSHLESNIEALSLRLSPEDIDAIESAYDFQIGFPHNFTAGENKARPKAHKTSSSGSALVISIMSSRRERLCHTKGSLATSIISCCENFDLIAAIPLIELEEPARKGGVLLIELDNPIQHIHAKGRTAEGAQDVQG